MKERNLQFDVARVLSMMWIVFVWYLLEYLDKDVRNILLFDGAYNVTTVALGTFMFISGYFLSKYKFENANVVKQFYLKRLKRFYFLFMLAAITMWLGYSSMAIYLFHRQLFAGVKYFFPVFPVWLVYLIVMPLTMFVGWSLQTIYDKAINSLEKKR